MKIKANLQQITRGVDDDNLLVTFSTTEANAKTLQELHGKDLSLEVKQYYKPRSLDANNYFWKLCGLMAEKQGTTKEEMHDLMLFRYGQWGFMQFGEDMLTKLKFSKEVDIIQIIWKQGDQYGANLYWASHLYNTQEMSRLLDGTIQDAQAAKCDILADARLKDLLESWEKDRNKWLR